MTNAIGWASSAWRLPNVESIERDRTAHHLQRATGELEALRATAADTRARADELSKPHIDAARRSNRNTNLGTAGAMVGMGAVTLGGISAAAAGAGARLAGGAVGAIAGAAFAGAAAAVMFQHASTEPTESQIARWPQEVRDAIEAARVAERAVPRTVGRGASQPLLSQIKIAREWEPGSTTVGYAGSGTIADFVEQHAGAFDHDGNGLVDLHAGSSELRRDVDGGPVGPGTAEVRRLHPFLAAGDADGDQRLSPEEAVIATVDEAVTSRDYQWWAPPR